MSIYLYRPQYIMHNIYYIVSQTSCRGSSLWYWRISHNIRTYNLYKRRSVSCHVCSGARNRPKWDRAQYIPYALHSVYYTTSKRPWKKNTHTHLVTFFSTWFFFFFQCTLTRGRRYSRYSEQNLFTISEHASNDRLIYIHTCIIHTI